MNVVIALALFLTAGAAIRASAATCESLAGVALKAGTINRAEVVAAGTFVPPDSGRRGGGGANPYANLPSFCRVAATLTPSTDSDIRIEVWLKEAQMFPDDYDGIIAGAPANRTAISLWIAHAVLKDPASYVPPAKYPTIHAAALAACD